MGVDAVVGGSWLGDFCQRRLFLFTFAGGWCKIVGSILQFGVIAQLIRAPPLQGGGPGFESLLLHQDKMP